MKALNNAPLVEMGPIYSSSTQKPPICRGSLKEILDFIGAAPALDLLPVEQEVKHRGEQD